MTDKDVQPIMDWDDQSGFKDMCCWKTRLDNRYQVEVHRKPDNDYTATLYMWDRDQDMKLVKSEDVTLSYQAIVGPDCADVDSWIEMALIFADSQ